MLLYFLAAADNTPLTKTFSSTFGVLSKSAYPNVRNFVSYEEEVATPAELYAAIYSHAERHHCLVKGTLLRQLNNESRQGSTDPQGATQWIVFDVDHLPGATTPEEFVAMLPPEFHNASYVTQYSCSAGFSEHQELRAHIFFLLSTSTPAPMLKLWMKHQNLESTQFNQHLSLAAGGCTLKWPVDISANQNDKLLYIAPPILSNIADPIDHERITLTQKENNTVTLNLTDISAERIKTAEHARINTLRAANGLEKRKIKTTFADGIAVIKNADQMTLTDAPFEERGFVYFPIGSNRHTYYHPVGNHHLLFSFKDPETAFDMRQVLPSYFWTKERELSAETTAGRTLLVFRDNKTDTKYIGAYTNDLTMVDLNQIRAREDIEDFFKQHHVAPPEIIPTWEFTFDPTTDVRIAPEARWINKFVPSQFMTMPKTDIITVPTRIEKLIYHVVGSDRETYEHFMNWLAWKFQTRKKCKTAWFFQGVEGTGKGVLFDKIVAPLFGRAYCQIKRMDALTDRFNADLETSLIWAIDEANIEDFKDAGVITEKLKNMITEDQQVIRAMRSNAYSVNNYTDFFMFSNRALAIKLSETDRRYNVCPRQRAKLLTVLTPDEIETIETDLPQFATYLQNRETNEAAVRTPLENSAKREAISVGMNTHDEFFSNLIAGNLAFFIAGLHDLEGSMMDRVRQEAEAAVTRWCRDIATTTEQRINVADVAKIYGTLMHPGKATLVTAQKMIRMLHLKGIMVDQHPSGLISTVTITWTCAETTTQAWLSTHTNTTQTPTFHGGFNGQQNRQTPN